MTRWAVDVFALQVSVISVPSQTVHHDDSR
jgi:hypothetical protein